MMTIAKNILRGFLYLALIPIAYIIIALILTWIPVSREIQDEKAEQIIYLNTSGVHLDIVIPLENLDDDLLSGLHHYPSERFLSFGWGDENFYLNTPTWGDLTFANAFKALFLESTPLMHITRYESKRSEWLEIKISEAELHKLNDYLGKSFKLDENANKIMLEGEGYSLLDDFYKANGTYTCFHTCNSWVNTGFQESGLKSCLWTPFDFGLMNKYE